MYGWLCQCTFVCAGLIIDAFGELRDQQEQVKEDMEVLRSLLSNKKSTY